MQGVAGGPSGGRVLAVAVLAVLAGCGGFSPGGSPAADTPTLTPAPVPVETTPSVPWVEEGSLDVEAVVDGHRAALHDRSHTVVEQLRIGPPDNATFRRHTVVTTNGSHFAVDDDVDDTAGGFLRRGTDVWWNGERAFYRYALSEREYEYYAVDQRPADPVMIDGRLRGVFGSLSVASVESTGGGATVVRGYLEDPSVVPRRVGATSVRNATLSVRVQSSGLVDRLAIGYDARYGNRRQDVRYTYRVTDVDATDVTRPAWVSAVENATENE